MGLAVLCHPVFLSLAKISDMGQDRVPVDE